MTDITRQAPDNSLRAARFDWEQLYIHAVNNPGEWFATHGGDLPKTNAYQIRRGTPRIFDPAGAFDAVTRRESIFIRYVGVPLLPWVPWEPGREFYTIPRTFDPDLFPADMFEERFDDFVAIAAEIDTDLKRREPHVLDPADNTRLVPITEHYERTGRAGDLELFFDLLEKRRAARA